MQVDDSGVFSPSLQGQSPTRANRTLPAPFFLHSLLLFLAHFLHSTPSSTLQTSDTEHLSRTQDMGGSGMFTFRKKTKDGQKAGHLVSHLRKHPGDSKARLKLADLYLREGDKKSAVPEYQAAARYLRQEGFNLKAISVYKKLFALDGMSLSDYRSLASIYTESGLLTEAKRTYERILAIKPQDRETLQALSELEKEDLPLLNPETDNNVEDLETLAADEADAVPIETLLAPSYEQNSSPDPASNYATKQPGEMDINNPFGNQETPEGLFPPGLGEPPHIDVTPQAGEDPFEATPSSPESVSDAREGLHGKLLRDFDLDDLSDDRESAEHDVSQDLDPQIDIASMQTDAPHEASTPFPEESPDVAEPPGKTIFPDMAAEDIASILNPSEDTDSHLERSLDSDSPQPAGSASFDISPDPLNTDQDLHYHLGVAYREMELTDRAIEEFTKALEEGSKSLECLIMLAKCYFEKGLFQEAASFVHRALKLENLTQDQIDQLHRQLEEAEAVGKLG